MLLPGDICICIKNFSSSLPGELLLYENDIVQIHKVIDKLWLEGKAAGAVGRFPASIVVPVEVPSHPEQSPLFVASADFDPIQEGDLRLRRGNFVIGFTKVDDAWWYGESAGKTGVFPVNHIWEISKDLLTKNSATQNVVSIKGKVLTSTHAQLPEEVDLYAGDCVSITNIIDEDWYRGVSCGQKGIFPSSCIEIINDDSANMVYISLEVEPGVVNEDIRNVFQMPGDRTVIRNGASEEDLLEMDIPPAQLPSIDNSWKNVNMDSDETLFEDDYFRQNMPSMYKSTTLTNNDSNKVSVRKTNNINETYMDSKLDVFDDFQPLNSLSAKVEEYLDDDSKCGSTKFNDLLDIDFSSIYTEDNTGIHPYGRAIFSFTAQYTNELSFKKGDVVHLIKHIDSHWTVGKLGDDKGIFPTSYIDIIVECPYKAEENFEKRPDSRDSFLGHALVCYDFDAINPEDVSIEKGDIVIIRRYINNEWVEIQKDEGNYGMVPLNHLEISEERGGKKCNPTLVFDSINSKRKYDKSDFSISREQDINSVLSKNLTSLNISLKKTEPVSDSSHIEDCSDITIKDPVSMRKFLDNFKPNLNLTGEEVAVDLGGKEMDELLHIQKTASTKDKMVLELKPVQIPMQPISHETQDKLFVKPLVLPRTCIKLPLSSSTSNNQKYSGENGTHSSSFPEDISSLSKANLSIIAKDTSLNSLELAPQRPAPPLPLDNADTEEDEGELSDSNRSVKMMLLSKSSGSTISEAEQLNEDSSANSKLPKMLTLRRESVNELVTTEHEYIHDLEALIQVVNICKSKKEAASVDLKVLMGNIQEVVRFAKKFVVLLDSVSYEKDDCLMISSVFIDVAEEMCEVYKVYSSNNSLSVGPLLNKYKEGGEPLVFLNCILNELRQHKINLLDMQAVLIKPIQRVLKYPLFIDNLLHNTPSSHPDYKNLEVSRKTLLNVAKEINEYTKRLDLVSKYRTGSRHSLGEIIHKVSMRSVAKKGSRFKTRISATMGLINQTRDLQFEEEESKFHSVVKATNAICEQGERILSNVMARHSAELGIIESVVASTFTKSSNVSAIKNICLDTNNRLLPIFEKITVSRVLNPTKTLIGMFKAPARLIQKRYDKLLDYDTAQHRLDKNCDPAKTRILEEELSLAKGVYEALNKQLLIDLPVLNERSIEVLQMAMKSLIATRMNLEGHIAKLYLDLAQIPEYSFQANPDYLASFKLKCGTENESLGKLEFLPAEFVLKSPKFGRRKSSFRSLGRESKRKISFDKAISTKSAVAENYDASNLYLVAFNHKGHDQFDLDVKAGTVVGVIKRKDPLGNSERWFVDDGEKEGFVASSLLKKYCSTTSLRNSKSGRPKKDQRLPSLAISASGSFQNAIPRINNEHGSLLTYISATEGSSLPLTVDQQNRLSFGAKAFTVDSRMSINPSEETPPRYDELFPGGKVVSKTSPSIPHRYDYPPEEDVGDGSPSHVQTSQTPETENIYEEIIQVNDFMGQPYSSISEEDTIGEEPFYEAISEEPSEPNSNNVIPQSESVEPQFFYALYNFGGADENQLSLYEGQVVLLRISQGNEWWFVEDRSGEKGYVPASYLAKYS